MKALKAYKILSILVGLIVGFGSLFLISYEKKTVILNFEGLGIRQILFIGKHHEDIDHEYAQESLRECVQLTEILESTVSTPVPSDSSDSWHTWKTAFKDQFDSKLAEQYHYIKSVIDSREKPLTEGFFEWRYNESRYLKDRKSIVHQRSLDVRDDQNSMRSVIFGVGVNADFIYNLETRTPVVTNVKVNNSTFQNFLSKILDRNISVTKIDIVQAECDVSTIKLKVWLSEPDLDLHDIRVDITLSDKSSPSKIKKDFASVFRSSICERLTNLYSPTSTQDLFKEKLISGQSVIADFSLNKFRSFPVDITVKDNGLIIYSPRLTSSSQSKLISKILEESGLLNFDNLAILSKTELKSRNGAGYSVLRGVCKIGYDLATPDLWTEIDWQLDENDKPMIISIRNKGEVEKKVTQYLTKGSVKAKLLTIDEINNILISQMPKLEANIKCLSVTGSRSQGSFKLGLDISPYPALLIPFTLSNGISLSDALRQSLDSAKLEKLAKIQWSERRWHNLYGEVYSFITKVNIDNGEIHIANDITLKGIEDRIFTEEIYDVKTNQIGVPKWRERTEEQVKRSIEKAIIMELTSGLSHIGLKIKPGGIDLRRYLKTGHASLTGASIILNIPGLENMVFILKDVSLDFTRNKIKIEGPFSLKLKNKVYLFYLGAIPLALTDPELEFNPRQKTVAFVVKLTPGLFANSKIPMGGAYFNITNPWKRFAYIELRMSLNQNLTLFGAKGALNVLDGFKLVEAEAKLDFIEKTFEVILTTSPNLESDWGPYLRGRLLLGTTKGMEFRGDLRLLGINLAAVAQIKPSHGDDAVKITALAKLLGRLEVAVKGTSDLKFTNPKLKFLIRKAYNLKLYGVQGKLTGGVNMNSDYIDYNLLWVSNDGLAKASIKERVSTKAALTWGEVQSRLASQARSSIAMRQKNIEESDVAVLTLVSKSLGGEIKITAKHNKIIIKRKTEKNLKVIKEIFSTKYTKKIIELPGRMTAYPSNNSIAFYNNDFSSVIIFPDFDNHPIENAIHCSMNRGQSSSSKLRDFLGFILSEVDLEDPTIKINVNSTWATISYGNEEKDGWIISLREYNRQFKLWPFKASSKVIREYSNKIAVRSYLEVNLRPKKNFSDNGFIDCVFDVSPTNGQLLTDSIYSENEGSRIGILYSKSSSMIPELVIIPAFCSSDLNLNRIEKRLIFKRLTGVNVDLNFLAKGVGEFYLGNESVLFAGKMGILVAPMVNGASKSINRIFSLSYEELNSLDKESTVLLPVSLRHQGGISSLLLEESKRKKLAELLVNNIDNHKVEGRERWMVSPLGFFEYISTHNNKNSENR